MKSIIYPKTRAHVEFPITGGRASLTLSSDEKLTPEQIKQEVADYFSHPDFHIDYFIWEDNG